MKPGKIVIGIDRKVYFEPDGLEKPMKKDNLFMWDGISFSELMQEYLASKQLIEVSNEISYYHKEWYIHNIKGLSFIGAANVQNIKNNQPCKAEVTGDTCTIVELTKQK